MWIDAAARRTETLRLGGHALGDLHVDVARVLVPNRGTDQGDCAVPLTPDGVSHAAKEAALDESKEH